jgi:hypothetical protein
MRARLCAARARCLILALLLAAAGLAPSSALAGVHAFRAADGSSDPAFVKLGSATAVDRIVPDGKHGAFLIGSIATAGGRKRIVHLRADGSVDPAFHPVISNGYVAAAAVSGGRLAVVGAFTAVDGQQRRGLAVLDVHTGRPLSWAPTRPRAARMDRASRVVYARGILVASTRAGIFAWRANAERPLWHHALVATTGPVSSAGVVLWRGAVWAMTGTQATGQRLISLAPETGRVTIAALDVSHAWGIDQVGGKLIVFTQGEIGFVNVAATSEAEPACDRVVSGDRDVVTSVGGNAQQLYLAADPLSVDGPGSFRGVVACGSRRNAFRPPLFSYTERGPLVTGIAVIGTRVLVFTAPG